MYYGTFNWMAAIKMLNCLLSPLNAVRHDTKILKEN